MDGLKLTFLYIYLNFKKSFLGEICGCKPWHVPAEDGTETCFVLGNVCFSQVMDKIRSKKVSADIESGRWPIRF